VVDVIAVSQIGHARVAGRVLPLKQAIYVCPCETPFSTTLSSHVSDARRPSDLSIGGIVREFVFYPLLAMSRV
jgi:hypothetical protein